jgi:hypothetical protein
MPTMMGKEKKKKELIANLDKIYSQLQVCEKFMFFIESSNFIQIEHNISLGDFPEISRMQAVLEHQDFTKFNLIKPKLIEVVDGMLQSDIGLYFLFQNLLKPLQLDSWRKYQRKSSSKKPPLSRRPPPMATLTRLSRLQLWTRK